VAWEKRRSPRGVGHVPPELLDGVEGVGLFEGGAPRGAGLGLRLDVVPEGPLPVQLVRPLGLRRGAALGRRDLRGRRRHSRRRSLNLRHVAPPPPLSEGFFLGWRGRGGDSRYERREGRQREAAAVEET
jgi:hypothetical protein